MAGNSFLLISQLQVIAEESQADLDDCIVQDYSSGRNQLIAHCDARIDAGRCFLSLVSVQFFVAN